MAITLKSGVALYLASASPRRRKLLSSLGLSFQVVKTNVREPLPSGETAVEYASKLAKLKGLSVALPAKQAIVISADTVVCVQNIILGKPRNVPDALRMLELLNGRQHEVTTAVYIRGMAGSLDKTLIQTTAVRFHHWPKSLLEAYASCGEPLDKAGAYAIQGKGSFLVDSIEGSWTNVVGLPVTLLTAFLLDAELAIPVGPSCRILG